MNHFTKEDLIREYYGGDKTMKEVGQSLGVAAVRFTTTSRSGDLNRARASQKKGEPA